MRNNIAVIWDMDGVITDTGEFHFITWRETLKEIDVEFKREDFVKYFGMKNHAVLENVMKKKLDQDYVEKLSTIKEGDFLRQIKGNIELLPGVKYCLEKFTNFGWQQAIASSAPQGNVDAILTELEIEPYFDLIFSADQPDLPDKSDPLVFLKVAELMGKSPKDCIVIEDSIAGVTGAKGGDMKCIAVTTTNPVEKLSAADLVFDKLSELTDEHLEGLFPSI